MLGIETNSKTFGKHFIRLDKHGFDKVRNLGGKWCLAFKRGRYYAQKRIDHHIIEMQRFITGAQKGEYVDHINKDTLDNRSSNLRVCSNAANIRNGKIRINNTSGVTGVSWSKERKKWSAYIKVGYKKIDLGGFDDLEKAKESRQRAEHQYWSI